MSNSSLWAFDPGQTTGVAEFDSKTGTHLRKFEIKTYHDIETFIKPGDIIVYEKITWRSPAFNPIGLEVSGVITYLATLFGCECFSQSPSCITGILKWPIYKESFSHIRSQHERDAIAHGIFYLGKKNIVVNSIITP